MPSRFRFGMRGLLAATLVVAVACATLTAAYRKLQEQMGYGRISEVDRWPRALKELIGDNLELRTDVSVYGLGNFSDADHRSLWLIRGESRILDRLFTANALKTASQSHPMANRLVSSIPLEWPQPDLSKCSFHATPGFGQRHIEGTDLFLVLRYDSADLTYVLHYWNF